MVERRIRMAKFPAVKSLDSFDFKAMPSLNRMMVLELARCVHPAILLARLRSTTGISSAPAERRASKSFCANPRLTPERILRPITLDYRDNRQRWAESHQVVHFYAGQWCTFTPALTIRDEFERLIELGIGYVHILVPEGYGDDLDAGIMPVQTNLRQKYPRRVPQIVGGTHR